MKHFLSIILAVAAAVLASCTTDDVLATKGSGTQRDVRLTLSIPDVMNQTRANGQTSRSSARGGLTNVDQTAYDLRYKIAVYEATTANGVTTYTLFKTKNNEDFVVAKGYEAEKSITLPYDFDDAKAYQVVCWADFIDKNTDTDKHYDTSDMQSITCKDAATAQLNDESRDAYFVSAVLRTKDVNTLTLRRPFAKLRVVTTDWAQEGYDDPNKITLTYKAGCKRFTGLNAVTGVATGADIQTGSEVECTANIPEDKTNTLATIKDKYYVMSYDATTHNRTVAVDYLLASDEQSAIQLNIKAKKDTKDLTGTNGVDVGPERITDDPAGGTQQIKTEIPIQRNYLTTILGNLCQREATKFTVSINQAFNGEWVDGEPWWSPYDFNPTEPQKTDDGKTYLISNLDEFAWLSCHGDGYDTQHANNHDNTAVNHDVKLTADIDMNNVTIWKPIMLNAANGTRVFDGNNHTIRNANVTIGYEMHDDGVQNLSLFQLVGNCTVKNLSFENVTLRGLHETQDARKYDDATTENYVVTNYAVLGTITSATDVKVHNVFVNHLFIYANGRDKSKIADNGAYQVNIGGIVASINGQQNGEYVFDQCTINDANIYLPAPSDEYNANHSYTKPVFINCGGIVGLLQSYGVMHTISGTTTKCFVHTQGLNDDLIKISHYAENVAGNLSGTQKEPDMGFCISNCAQDGFSLIDQSGTITSLQKNWSVNYTGNSTDSGNQHRIVGFYTGGPGFKFDNGQGKMIFHDHNYTY